jgi:hypothetical protein
MFVATFCLLLLYLLLIFIKYIVNLFQRRDGGAGAPSGGLGGWRYVHSTVIHIDHVYIF